MAPKSGIIKANLKAARAALDAEDYAEAIAKANSVIDTDSSNQFAYLFIGRAEDKSGRPDAAEAAYKKASELKPNDDQVWLGLRALYEAQGASKVGPFVDVSVRLAEIYAAADDAHRCQSAVDKAVGFARQHGSRQQYARALELQLPGTSFYGVVEGRVPHPGYTYRLLAEMTETEESERVNRMIGERRTRLGARIANVTAEVKREVYGKSGLEGLLQNVIDWAREDDVRREFEEKLLSRAYEAMAVQEGPKKEEKRSQVVEMARGMVIIKHSFLLAWQIELEWKDVEEVGQFDVGVFREFVEFFPDNGLAKVLRGFLGSDISPFAPPPKDEAEGSEDEVDGGVELGPDEPEDAILLMTEGIEDAKESALAHRLVGQYYVHIEEHESAVLIARNGIQNLSATVQKSGMNLQHNFDAVHSILATALIRYQAPKNHPEAKELFDDILKRKPKFTQALIGIGLIYEDEELYPEAIDFLSRAVDRDPSNVDIGAEAAWCKALSGDFNTAQAELKDYVQRMDVKDPKTRDLRAQTLYRIGWCKWEVDRSKAARKDRTNAYADFLAAIKTNPSLAPAYTSLGFFYADYARDKKRARQCFQKAFELSSSEIEAAERLATSFADQGDWEVVELIAQRAIDSGRVKPAPGSKRRGSSWPFSALGVAQMNKQEYSKSIASFLAALRIRPDDYHSYVGLGESYHNSGRYNSAARTLQYAENPPDGIQMKKSGESWFTRYMLANVNRELGDYDAAIVGYEDVLKTRTEEFGVEIALLQTFVERAWNCIEIGFYGQAADDAVRAVDIATAIARHKPDAFNLWKAVGDACSIFASVQGKLEDVPFIKIAGLLKVKMESTDYDALVDVDGVGSALLAFVAEEDAESPLKLLRVLIAAILAQKRAIHSCMNDIHAQAVSWYNLGWTQYLASTALEQSSDTGGTKMRPNKFLRAAMRSFKRAIELEAGNSDFWNALGVVTTNLNPKVAQHCFVRSLFLNERSARTWTNLGAMYLLQNDFELAQQAFGRGQSQDPDYAHAWLGQGLLSLISGDTTAALSQFTHAFEIANSASLITSQQYAVSTFDYLQSAETASSEIAHLIQPLFSLRQLHSQRPSRIPPRQLTALYLERIGDHGAAISTLEDIASDAEAEYEVSESPAALESYACATADLARNLLATSSFEKALSSAETVLDLTSADPSDSESASPALTKPRLSALLTAGLAAHHLSDSSTAITHFRAALEATRAAPDVVCLLACVLWAVHSPAERSVARAQLRDATENNPHHADSAILLAVVAVLDGDAEAVEAAREDLGRWRASEELDARGAARIEKVLAGIAAAAAAPENKEGDVAGAVDAAVALEAQRGVMIAPGTPRAWAQLADAARFGGPGDEDDPQGGNFAAEMALLTARRNVPPGGELAAAELAEAFAGTGRVADAVSGVFVAPWRAAGWETLASVIAR